jgi:hypothetical protein
MLEAQQLDSYGLQFSKPTFISLNSGASVSNLPIAGIRIGVNGSDRHGGQAFIPLSSTIGATYTPATGQQMSPYGTVIGLERGIMDDLFFLSFERIGDRSRAYPDPEVPDPADPEPMPAESDVGLRTFDELNATLSQITGVPTTNARVTGTFETVKQGLPSIEKLASFGPSQQTALAQLAIQYCGVMVDDNTLRANFFGALDGSGTGTAAFGAVGDNTNANRIALVNTLFNKIVGTGLASQPDLIEIRDEIAGKQPANDPNAPGLINRLVSGPTGSSSTGGRTVMKAACGAVLGSGNTLIQ